MLYVPALQSAGFHVQLSSMFSDTYLSKFYERGRKSLIHSALAYFRRAMDTVRLGRFDVIWLEKELFPFWPGAFERFLAAAGVPYIVDYDDAIFHNYDQHASRWVRQLLGRKLVSLVRNSFAVTVGNRYLADWASRSGAHRVELIPTVIEHQRYLESVEREPGNDLRIGWIGTPVTTPYLWLIRDALKRIFRTRPMRLITVGAAPLVGYGVPVEQHSWSVETEAVAISKFDIGIMPLRDSPWERGKCGYKLIQYLGCGKPVVASPIGVNVEIVRDNDVGFLAGSSEEWTLAIEKLAGSEALRRTMGINGRKLVAQRFSVNATSARVVSLMVQACNSATA